MAAVNTIKHQARCEFEIEHVETEATLSKCNLQMQSPLFALLPRELRQYIWTFATAPHEDERQPYERNKYYYRPGHTARLRTETSLLFTCRGVWLEANSLPMLQAEQAFWYYREAPDQRTKEWIPKLTRQNRENLGHLHMFAQMYAIEGLSARRGHIERFLGATGGQCFNPRLLEVTIRHTDWWYWEDEAPLRFRDSWLQALLDSPDLHSTHTVRLELETLDYKVNQLMPIVRRLSQLTSSEYKTHTVDGQEVTTKFVLHGEPEVYQWSGPIDIDGRTFQQYEQLNELRYHVVTLTWRLAFPAYPHGHIPRLRLAPRYFEQDSGHGPSLARMNDVRNSTSDNHAAMLSSMCVGPCSHARCRDAASSLLRNQRSPKTVCTRRSTKARLGTLWLEMQETASFVLNEARRRALVLARGEQVRFEADMAAFHAAQWKKRWEAENSLLYLPVEGAVTKPAYDDDTLCFDS